MSFLNLYVLEKFVYFFKCDNVKVGYILFEKWLRALKKYPFSLQHTFFDPSKLAP